MIAGSLREMCGCSRCCDFAAFWWGLLDPFHETRMLTGSLRAMCSWSRCGDFIAFWSGLPQLGPGTRIPSMRRACSLTVTGRCAADLGAAISLRSGGVCRNLDPFHETSVLTGSPRAMWSCSRCGDFTAFWWGLPQLGPLPRNERAHWQSPGDVRLLSVRRFRSVLVGFAATLLRN